MIRLFAPLLFVMTSIPAFAQVPTLDQAGNPVECTLQDRVELPGFYSFEIPLSFEGCRIWPRVVTIPLGDRTENRLIHVGWEHNATFYESLADLQAFYCDKAECSTQCMKTSLQGYDALRTLVRKCEAMPTEIYESFILLGKDTDDHGTIKHVFFIRLVTDHSHEEHDRDALNMLIGSWRYE
jgi:hypothetical protein